jgi:hypothetical protein
VKNCLSGPGGIAGRRTADVTAERTVRTLQTAEMFGVSALMTMAIAIALPQIHRCIRRF